MESRRIFSNKDWHTVIGRIENGDGCMENQFEDDYEERRRIRAERNRRMRKNKKRQQMVRKMAPFFLGAVVLALVVAVALGGMRKARPEKTTQEDQQEEIAVPGETTQQEVFPNQAAEEVSDVPQKKEYKANTTERTVKWADDIFSDYAIFINTDTQEVLLEKNGYVRMNPASMTKVLTILVAAEQIQNLEDSFVMTQEITDYSYVHDCSAVGFSVGEKIPLKDLFYGAIMPSGADASLGLACYVSGSQEEFVKLMNEKLRELGLSDTAHFTNCVGIYDENHYCTAYDMAMIMEAALDNEWCREVMSAKRYTTTPTTEHPEGISISNLFLRRIEDHDTGGEVICGKTGYVVQSGSCAVSYGKDHGGTGYVCVTVSAPSKWRCVEDHSALYLRFAES